ncbi:MAG: long-chain-fatty-acid--CoA ligase [Halioglobus sp.]
MYQRLDDYLDYHARVHEDVVFVTDESISLTFAQAQQRIDRIASRLAAGGLQKGDRIALLGKNSIDFFFMYLACARLGLVPVGINYRLTATECAFIIADSTAGFLFADSEFIAAVDDECSGIESVCLYGQHGDYAAFDEWLGTAEPDYDRADIEPDDVMSQMYTSGTTGLPKGVLLSHDNVIANVYQTAMASEYTFMVGEEFLLVAPMYHAAGIMTGYTGVVQGLTLVIHRDYDPQRVVTTLAHRAIAAVTLVPAMLQFIIDNIPGLDAMSFPSLRVVYYGASPISVPLLQRAIEIFCCDFTQGYGQTEANSIVAMLSASDHRKALANDPDLLKACGRATFNTELRIIDSDNNTLPPGRSGEIVARGPQVMLGYWNNPKATAETIVDGWLHTGDMGQLDEHGYLTIVGRLKDMIISGGENIYPVEIENVLMNHAQVKEAAVIGVAHPKWGEVPLAVLVVEAGEPPTDQQLTASCREQLAKFKVPAHFHMIPELPRNPSGKILKQQLRDELGAVYGE